MTNDPKNVRGQQRRNRGARKLDLVFIQDTTGSQGKYIQASLTRCKDVCYALQRSGKLEEDDGLHLAVIAFRDQGQNDEYVTRDFNGFTNNVDSVVQNLGTLSASGGGDGPEALAAALGNAMDLKWRRDSAKVAVIITDAPPHGIGEAGDFYRDGDPDGKDPLLIARTMARRGIAIFFVACEPTLSNYYTFAHDFYMALAKLTSGSMLPLTNTEILAPLIVGFALEHLEVDSLTTEFEPLVAQFHREGMSEADIVNKLFALMRSRSIKVTSLKSTPVYSVSPTASQNILKWMKAQSTKSGRDQMQGIPQEKNRVPDEFITPDPWPKTQVSITLKNLGDEYILFYYSENGVEKSGKLDPKQIGPNPTIFMTNTPYLFSLKKGRNIQSTPRTFTKEESWDLSVYFDS